MIDMTNEIKEIRTNNRTIDGLSEERKGHHESLTQDREDNKIDIEGRPHSPAVARVTKAGTQPSWLGL